jgi:hypothetical protein
VPAGGIRQYAICSHQVSQRERAEATAGVPEKATPVEVNRLV